MPHISHDIRRDPISGGEECVVRIDVEPGRFASWLWTYERPELELYDWQALREDQVHALHALANAYLQNTVAPLL